LGVQERYLRVLGVAQLELTHHVLPGMVSAGWGRIINVSSMACLFTGSPSQVVYAGAKSMVRQVTEGIATEVAGTGVNCTVSIPGITESEIFIAAGVEDAVRARWEMRKAMMSPNRVAREAYAAVMAGRRSVIHGRRHQLIGVILTVSPARARRYMSRKMMDPITPP
jgi:short-subunit dehydrogenase